MLKKEISKIISMIIMLCLMLPTLVIAAPGDVQKIQYYYFEDTSSQMVIVDYAKAINDAINGDKVLYNSIKDKVGTAILVGTPVYLETTIGNVLDYQKAITDNKPYLVDIQDDPIYQTVKPEYTMELTVVGGVATIIPIVTPVAPAVTNDDTANTVSGMVAGLEYNLDDAGYVAYVAATFDVLDFSGNHTLLVRVAATGTVPAGEATTLIFTTNPVTPPAPLVTNDDTANTVSGMVAGLEYNLDGAGYVAYEAAIFDALDFSGNHTLLVRVAAEGNNPPSLATTLTFTATINETAEAAVSAYETAPINNMAQIIVAEALKAPAEAAVAALTDPTLQASMFARIAAKDVLIANTKANLTGLETEAQANALAAVIAFESQQPGTYNSVNNIMNTPKATADAKVLLVKDMTLKEALQLRITAKVNTLMVYYMNKMTAYNATQFEYYIGQFIPYLGLDFTQYNLLASKVPVHTAMLDATFVSFIDIQTVFNNAVTAQKALESGYLEAFNSAADAAAIGTAITTYATQLSLTLNQYNALSPADKTAVQSALLGKNFTSGGDIRTAFLIAMINSSPVNSILTEDNALFLGLGTSGEYQAAYGKTAIEAGITAARPIADKTQLIVVAISSSSHYLYLSWRLPYFKDIMGLDLTDYNGLRNKDMTAVQNELIAATMTTKLEVQNAFNAIVAAKKVAEAPALTAFNNAVSIQDVAMAITTYLVAGELGDYNLIANKTPVYNTVLMQTYTTLKQVESMIKAASTTQRTLEKAALDEINGIAAGNTSGMDIVLLKNASTLSLNITDYNNFIEQDKLAVQTAMIDPYFTNVQLLITAFNTAISTQKVVIAINNANAATIGSLITTNATLLGLTLTDYNSLTEIEKSTVLVSMVGRSFADKTAVKNGLDAAVAVPIFNSVTTTAKMAAAITFYNKALGFVMTDYNMLSVTYKTAVQNELLPITFLTGSEIKSAFEASSAAQRVNYAVYLINSATTTSTMNTAIVNQATILGLDLTEYNSLSNKVPVQTAMLTPVFVTALDVKTALDTAVAVAKVNEATLGTMSSILTANAIKLGLDLTDYNALLSNESVHTAMLAPVFLTAADVKTAFDAAVLAQKIIETPIQADMTAYNAALAAVTEADYTAESWTAYLVVVAANVVTEGNTQAEVDAATAAITNAQGNLVAISVLADMTAYNTALAAVTEADYTAESWTVYLVVVSANVVTEANTQAEVDAATAAITNAQENLVAITVLMEPIIDELGLLPLVAQLVVVDKSAIEAKITETDGLGLVQADYTEASWTLATDAFLAAVEVRDNAESTQAEVDAALSVVNDAYEALELLPEVVNQ